MLIYWPLVLLVFFLSLPGVFVAVPRLIQYMLQSNSDELKKRVTRLAVGQTILMIFLMSLAGSALCSFTGLSDPILQAIFKNESVISVILDILLPVFLYTIGGVVIFFLLYYGLVASILDEHTLIVMKKIRQALKLGGCVLYGGISEEIMVRWGLLNVLMFFGILMSGQRSPWVFWIAMILSALMFSLGQLPAYIAAGAKGSRRFAYAILILNSWLGILFGVIFWQYGILATLASHSVFHIIWWLYDNPNDRGAAIA